MSAMQKIFYLNWKTWQENEIHTPWDFWYLAQGSEYRPRKSCNSKLKPSIELMSAAFESLNSRLIDEIDQNFVLEIKLAAFVDAEDAEDAANQVINCFVDAEFEKIVEVNDAIKSSIIAVFVNAVKQKAD